VSPRVVEVVIDELVLEGLGRSDRERVAAAAERGLARMLAGGAEWRGGHGPVVVVADAIEPAGDGPEAVGAELARAVHGELAQ
jgi:hypothetical protein